MPRPRSSSPLYQRVGTHLAALRAAGADPVSIGRLSGLIADARGAVTGAQAPVWRDISKYFLVSFPAALYVSQTLVAHHRPAVLPGRGLGGLADHRAPRGGGLHRDAGADPGSWSTRSSRPTTRRTRPRTSRSGCGSTTPRSVPSVLALGILLIPSVFILWDNALNLGVNAGPDDRPRPGGRLLRPDHPARPARADRGLRRVRGRPAARLVLDRPRPAHPHAGARPDRPRDRRAWRSAWPRSCWSPA